MSIHVRPQSLAKARSRALRISVPIEPHASPRACLEAQIEFLIALLDHADSDVDLEENGDLEPSIGTYRGVVVDVEDDSADEEPSLGWPDRMVNQEHLEPRGWNAASDLELDRCDFEDGGDAEDGGDTELNGDESEGDGERDWPNPMAERVGAQPGLWVMEERHVHR